MIGIAIVGFGKIAQDQHVGAIDASLSFFLHSIAEQKDITVTVPRFESIDAMLAASDRPSAVAICTPPQARFEIARTALTRGVHVLLEKPPCATVAEVNRLAELARNTRTTLFSAWHSRFAVGVLPAREWLKSRKIRRVRIDWREDFRVWHPGQDWIWEPGGYGVFDPGINALSIVTDILPQRLSVRDALLRVPENLATPIAAELELSDADGTGISASFDFLHPGPPVWTIEIETDQGRLHLLEGGSRLLLDGETRHPGPNREYPALYAHFATLIGAGRSDVDAAPLELVADALAHGRREVVAPVLTSGA